MGCRSLYLVASFSDTTITLMKTLICIFSILLSLTNLRAQQSNQQDTTRPMQQGQQGWVQVPVPATSGLLFASATGSDTVWAGAYLLRSTDRGLTWGHPNAPFSNAAISFYNSKVGCLIPGPMAYVTKDGGATWDSAITGMNDIHAVQAITADTLFAGFYYQVSRSTNGGKSWTPTSLPTLSLNAISFSDSKHGFAVCGRQDVLPDSPQVAGVFRTVDGGNSWQLVYSGLKHGLISVAAISDSIVIAVADEGYICRTTNAGRTWTDSLVTLLNFGFEGVTMTKTGQGVAVGADNKILYTSNGGVSWVDEPIPTSQTMYAASFIDESTIVVVGDKGTVLRTTNRGLSWVSQPQQFQELSVQTFPNPSASSTQFSFTLPQSQHVTLSIYSVDGMLVQPLLNREFKSAGTQTTLFRGADLPTGTYMYQLTSEIYQATGQFQLVK
jgi:photosystem II stability/assembly factor-like uncharacterized protein